jgi:hypothetical protein
MPVVGAMVLVLGQESSAYATTDAEGGYSIPGVQSAPVEQMSPLLSASKRGFFTAVEFARKDYAPIRQDTQLDFTLITEESIPVGHVVTARATSQDRVCSHWGYGSGACRRFAVTTPSAGWLDVRFSAVPFFRCDVDIVGPGGTFVLYDPSWRNPLNVSIPVVAGATYEIRVICGSDPSHEFELGTTLR